MRYLLRFAAAFAKAAANGLTALSARLLRQHRAGFCAGTGPAPAPTAPPSPRPARACRPQSAIRPANPDHPPPRSPAPVRHEADSEFLHHLNGHERHRARRRIPGAAPPAASLPPPRTPPGAARSVQSHRSAFHRGYQQPPCDGGAFLQAFAYHRRACKPGRCQRGQQGWASTAPAISFRALHLAFDITGRAAGHRPLTAGNRYRPASGTAVDQACIPPATS